MDKRIWIVLIICCVVMIIIGTLVALLVRDSGYVPDNNENEIVSNTNEETDKLNEYISSLRDNYYIKYSGKFENNSGELVDATVEFTKAGENFGMESKELDMYIICEGERLYTISHRYKILLELSREHLDISEYNFVSNFGQIFIKSYTEKINNTVYDVEEYLHNGKALKYYFNQAGIKYIKYGEQEITVLRVEKNTYEELLIKPDGYSYAIS